MWLTHSDPMCCCGLAPCVGTPLSSDVCGGDHVVRPYVCPLTVGSDLLPTEQREAEQLLKRAILQSLAYADVFDYPLTAGEVHRRLIGLAATPEAIQAMSRKRAPGAAFPCSS